MDVMLKQTNLKHVITLIVCVTFILLSGCSDSGEDEIVSFTILQTSDVHHHATGYGPQKDYTPLDSSDNDSVKGGYARLASLIKSIRNGAASDDSVLVFDSGDFLMGTIYDLTYTDPVAFKFFETIGYDAVTLGNHEFDWGPEKLAELIEAGKASGFDVPIVASNMITDAADSGDDDIENLVSDGTIVESKIITITQGVNVGILGIMGSSANSVAPLATPVTFNHDYDFLQQKVNDLYAAGAHIVILLSHTGVDESGIGEDADIAENVTGIQIIASGHMHTVTPTAFAVLSAKKQFVSSSNTLIFSPGEYGSYLSRLDVRLNKDKKAIVGYSFKLIPVDDSVAGDSDMNDMVADYESVISAALSSIGADADTVVSKTDFDLEMKQLTETGFGNLVADAIRAAATDLDEGDTDDYNVGIVASGVIRDNLYQGKTGEITFSDIYNALPLGISIYGDTDPGYPLMNAYVTPMELRNICEVSISAAPLMGSDFYLNVSGIRYDYNASNPLMSRVTDVYMCDTTDMNTEGPCTQLDLDDTTLYRVVVNHYALSMMDVATNAGLVIIPKDKSGTALSSSDYGNIRIDISLDSGIQELKEWMALNHFLSTYYPSSGAGIPSAVYGPSGTGMGRANAISGL